MTLKKRLNLLHEPCCFWCVLAQEILPSLRLQLSEMKIKQTIHIKLDLAFPNLFWLERNKFFHFSSTISFTVTTSYHVRVPLLLPMDFFTPHCLLQSIIKKSVLFTTTLSRQLLSLLSTSKFTLALISLFWSHIWKNIRSSLPGWDMANQSCRCYIQLWYQGQLPV